MHAGICVFEVACGGVSRLTARRPKLPSPSPSERARKEVGSSRRGTSKNLRGKHAANLRFKNLV
ncbi:hypothetical protein B1812_04475 [Methylocystis bryophila]|uniref:Uncharacterized protein n=1 Tax=Methylocystis bryophila TaxID=655015 RepID=A0A1W6MS64_9HYPH|nr:hypothetical protein B1812_04475 [Methylocystis bryophila]